VATAGSVIGVGAVPIFAEVDDSLTLDASDVEKKITPHTKAIIVVHMRGAPCNMNALMSLAKAHNIPILEDSAQANGATYEGHRVGSIAPVGAFSTQFNKIITCGEGGFLTTNDEKLWKRALMFHDVIRNNEVPEDERIQGLNLKMAEIPAAIFLEQIKKHEAILHDMRAHRAAILQRIGHSLSEANFVIRRENDSHGGDSAISLIFFAPNVEEATFALEALRAEGLGVSVALLYQVGVVDMHVYRCWGGILAQRSWSPQGGPWVNHPRKIDYLKDYDCPRTIDLLTRAIHVDISPDLTHEQIEQVSEALLKVLAAVIQNRKK